MVLTKLSSRCPIFADACQENISSRFQPTVYVQACIRHFLKFNDIFISLNYDDGLSSFSTPPKIDCIMRSMDSGRDILSKKQLHIGLMLVVAELIFKLI